MDPDLPDIDDGLDFRAGLLQVASHPWWLLASVLLFSGAFSAAALMLTPMYRATTILIPTKQNRDIGASGSSMGIGGVASLVGLNLGGADSLTEEALAVLRSRQFNEKFIAEKGLMPILFASKWDAAVHQWKVGERQQPSPAKAYRYFNSKVRSVAEDKKTGMVALNIDWTDRALAAEWANELVQRLNREMRQRETARADSSIGYLEKAFASTEAVATREAIGRLIEGQVKQRMLANVTPEFAFRVIDPAMVPDRDDPSFPPRLVFVIAGPLVGLLIGALGILGYGALRSNKKRAAGW